jgi:DNA-binding transcriptional LysR family regulator
MAPPLTWHDGWRLGEETIAVAPRLTVNSGEVLRAAAIAGMGLVAVPDWLVGDALASGQLMRVLETYETPVSPIYAVYPTNRLLTPVARAFVDHLARDLRARGVPA